MNHSTETLRLPREIIWYITCAEKCRKEVIQNRSVSWNKTIYFYKSISSAAKSKNLVVGKRYPIVKHKGSWIFYKKACGNYKHTQTSK